MIEFKRAREKKSITLNLTPLIDMVFLLLIFFLLTSFYTRPSHAVTLPESDTAEQDRTEGVNLTIKKDGVILLGAEPVLPDELPLLLEREFLTVQKKEINILADRGVTYGRIIEVLDIAVKAGAEDFFFIVKRKE
jgi:biopolymer transport protein ExbD